MCGRWKKHRSLCTNVLAYSLESRISKFIYLLNFISFMSFRVLFCFIRFLYAEKRAAGSLSFLFLSNLELIFFVSNSYSTVPSWKSIHWRILMEFAVLLLLPSFGLFAALCSSSSSVWHKLMNIKKMKLGHTQYVWLAHIHSFIAAQPNSLCWGKDFNSISEHFSVAHQLFVPINMSVDCGGGRKLTKNSDILPRL